MRIVLALFLMVGTALGQLTPQQIENAAAPYRFYSARDLAVANTYLLSVIVGMGSTSPATILASASAWKAFADRDLQNAQTYLLSQFAGSVMANAQSTNNGVLSTNGNNILISPNSTIATFTNASGAIAIGSSLGVGTVTENGIYIGGNNGGSAGTNSISIGYGAGAVPQNTDLSISAVGSVALGNQVDSFGPGSIVIGNLASYAEPGSYNSVVIGNASSTGGGGAVTNCWVFGHNFNSPANNTFYFGNGAGANTNNGRTRNFVFINGGAYNDDGAIIGNGFGLTNRDPSWKTNLFASAGTVDPNTNKIFFLASSSAVTMPGFANLDFKKYYEPIVILSNSSGSAWIPAFLNGTRVLTNSVNSAGAFSIPGGKVAQAHFFLYPHLGQFMTNVEFFVQSN